MQVLSKPHARCLVPAGSLITNGSTFSHVRRELGDNPTTVKNMMPTIQMMQGIAEQSDLQLIIPSFLGTEIDDIERNFESFYLVILQRKATEMR